MSTLRRFLHACFAGQAVIFFLMIPILFRPLLEHGPLPETTRGVIGAVLAQILLATPLVQTVCCGIAWWTLQKRKASGRK